MRNLRIIAETLQRKKNYFAGRYFIPEDWNYLGCTEFSWQHGREGEISVNPYEFFAACMKWILDSGGKSADAAVFQGRIGQVGEDLEQYEISGENLCRNVIYGMFPRTFTAWNHYEDDRTCPGTFLKSLCLLPYLRALGVDIVYLLPIFESSEKYKKGEIGSPYAIKNLYKLDRNLHDELLGEYSDELLHTEFKAFVEACHRLGIRVMLDFAFRTVSRDNDLIIDHPDWFYWIDLKYNEDFRVPAVEKEKKPVVLQDKSLKNLYTCSGMREHLIKFTHSPDRIDAERWRKIRERRKRTGENILELIEEEFGITTAPGFSDVINDPQPPWTDVTYLKYYFDLHPKARRYVSGEYPPFILQDGVCLNLYQGEVLNRELWEYIVRVIPYYQKEFGIDGARIDMGHALPSSLIRDIVAGVKELNPRFILWSEEFHAENSAAAQEGGFDFITGSLWHLYKGYNKPGFQRRLLKDLSASVIPVTAAPETADTPRFAHVFKNKRIRKLLLLLNYFLPNTIPFINNGLELAERQPMNLGLDNTEEGRFALESSDPMYGKLAFFDHYRLHWLNEEREWMEGLLTDANYLRRRFIGTLTGEGNFSAELSQVKNKKLIFLCYHSGAGGLLFFVANKDLERRARVNFRNLLPKEAEKYEYVNIAYAGGELKDEQWLLAEVRMLEPGEVVIGYSGETTILSN